MISFRAQSGSFQHDVFQNCIPSDTKWIAKKAWQFYKSTIPSTAVNEHLLLDEVLFLMESKTGISDDERTFCGYRREHNWEAASTGKELLSNKIMIRSNYNLRNRIM